VDDVSLVEVDSYDVFSFRFIWWDLKKDFWGFWGFFLGDGFMFLFEEKTKVIIGCFYDVYNVLGYGFLEQVYENALIYELRKKDFQVKKQHPITVFYKNISVGEYFADIIVDDTIILELKTSDNVHEAHVAQLRNYLKATKTKLGLLLYFGKEAKVRRISI